MKPNDALKDSLGLVDRAVFGAMGQMQEALRVQTLLQGPPPKVAGKLTREAATKIATSLQQRAIDMQCLQVLVWLLLLVKQEETRERPIQG
jgi:hypothetical protein